jgi:hypothetical protein
MLLRRLLLEEGQSVELLAKGDVLLPLHEESASFSRAEWEVVEEAELAERIVGTDERLHVGLGRVDTARGAAATA